MLRKTYSKNPKYGGWAVLCLALILASTADALTQAGSFRWAGTGNGKSWSDVANWEEDIDGQWRRATRYPGMNEDEMTITLEEDDELLLTDIPFQVVNGKPIFFVGKCTITSGTVILKENEDTPDNALFLFGPPLKSQSIPGFVPGQGVPDNSVFPPDNPTLHVLPAGKLIIPAALSSNSWQVPRFCDFLIGGQLFIR